MQVPVRVEIPEPVKKIAAGHLHTLCLTSHTFHLFSLFCSRSLSQDPVLFGRLDQILTASWELDTRSFPRQRPRQ